ncbi:hypothetical protein [Solirubrobacter soli]|uniref:hypothetical protein n=1 Tax=Solirubrobacter soli TaxID=363832 RepID=UPI00040C5564|nr:hypothetical protein [Solirubrobacter soli]
MSALEPALAGRPLDRPLLAPRFAALAAEVEELPLEAFLADLGRRARIYADLARSLRVDVLFVNDADEEPEVLADLLRRVRATVPTTLGAVMTGPATRGELPSVLAAARTLAEAGAEVILVRETVALPENYRRLANPLWGSLKFFRAVGVLLAPDPPAGPYLPCLTAATDAPHALAVAPGEASAPSRATALITHTDDLAGHVPVRDLQAVVARL